MKIIKESIDEDLFNARNATNRKPTEAQKKAGNYKKGHININGFRITIETSKGTKRSGKGKDGHEWEVLLPHDYGYLVKTKGKDKTHIDVIIGDDLESKKIYVVDQKEKGKFDESKVMFCFDSIEKAKQGYDGCYEEGWRGFWKITPCSLKTFKKWLYDGHMQYKPFFKYVDIIKSNKKEKLSESKLTDLISESIKKLLCEWKPDNYDEMPDVIDLYHGTSDYELNEILESGVISARSGRQHGETRGVNWFTTHFSLNFSKGAVFHISVPKSDFENHKFQFMNNSEVTCYDDIPIKNYPFHIDRLNHKNADTLQNAFEVCKGDIFRVFNLFKKDLDFIDSPAFIKFFEEHIGKGPLQQEGIIEERKFLNEGYSSKYVEGTIDKHIPLIYRWIERCKNGERREDKEGIYTICDEYKANLKPFKKENEYMQQKYLRNFKIPFKYYFEPDRKIPYNCNAITNIKGEHISVDVFFNQNVTPETLKSIISHELTHAIDNAITSWKGSWGVGKNIKTHNHVNELIKQLPEYIRMPIYWLWDTTEFNAWQSSLNVMGGFNKFFERCMNYLEEANADNNPENWIALGRYLTENGTKRLMGMVLSVDKNFENKSWESIKKYFLNTSFNKLKKFIKKAEV